MRSYFDSFSIGGMVNPLRAACPPMSGSNASNVSGKLAEHDRWILLSHGMG
jgi:hypothetical protein